MTKCPYEAYLLKQYTYPLSFYKLFDYHETMNRLLVTLATITVLSIIKVSAQKVRIKKNTVFVNKIEYLKLEKDSLDYSYHILKNLKGEELFRFRTQSYKDPGASNQANPSGNVNYYEVKSPEGDTTYFEYGSQFSELMIVFYNGKFVNDDGTVNWQNFNKVAIRFGMEHTRKRNELCK